MDFLPEDISKYAEDHTSPESDLLKQINRDTHANVMMPRMLSGHLQGRFLSMVSHLIKPTYILEVGTYTDVNEELESRVRKYFEQARLSDKIEYLIGDAAKLIPSLSHQFDIVFIDADKENYSVYYDLVFDKVAKGGLIMADNVLWSGKVVKSKTDKDTRAILEFNEKVRNDTRVEVLLLPLRDGILMARKM